MVDATVKEEMCTDASLVVGVNRKGQVCSMQKTGSCSLPVDMMSDMIETAKTLGCKLISRVESVAGQSHRNSPDIGAGFLVS